MSNDNDISKFLRNEGLYDDFLKIKEEKYKEYLKTMKKHWRDLKNVLSKIVADNDFPIGVELVVEPNGGNYSGNGYMYIKTKSDYKGTNDIVILMYRTYDDVVFFTGMKEINYTLDQGIRMYTPPESVGYACANLYNESNVIDEETIRLHAHRVFEELKLTITNARMMV